MLGTIERKLPSLPMLTNGQSFYSIVRGAHLKPSAAIHPICCALQRQKLDGDGLGRAYAMMERQVAHLTGLVDDLLDVSRVTRGLVETRKESVNIGDVAA